MYFKQCPSPLQLVLTTSIVAHLLLACSLLFASRCMAIQYLDNRTEYSPEEQLEEGRVKTSENANLHRCGGVFRSVNVTIHYKPFEKVLPNERCVWLVASTNGSAVASSYRVTTTSMGFSNFHNKLLSLATLEKNTETMEQEFAASQGDYVLIRGRVLIVAFLTKNIAQEQNGFVLTITSTRFKEGVNPLSRYEILDPDEYFHSHPPTSGAYLNDELTALVYQPISQSLQGFRSQVIGCKERGLEEFFADWIGVHFFDNSTRTWKYKGR